MSVNKCLLVGRLGADPELRYTQDGKAICKFSLATSEYIKEKEVTQWHRVVVFGKTAERCGKHLRKGSQVFVEGAVHYGSYVNKEGVKCYTTDINSFHVSFLADFGSTDEKPGLGQDAEDFRPTATQPPQSFSASSLDDIPF